MITRSRMHRPLTYAAWRARPGIDAVSAHHLIHRLVAAGYIGKAPLAVARSGEAIVTHEKGHRPPTAALTVQETSPLPQTGNRIGIDILGRSGHRSPAMGNLREFRYIAEMRLRIPTKRATDSERRRPSIPIDGGQGFR